MPKSPTTTSPRPVGTHHLHEDASINVQLNRWITWIAWTGGGALADIRPIAPQLSDDATNRRLFRELADVALTDGDVLRSAFHVRAADFFIRGDDPDKKPLRARLVDLILRSRGRDHRDRIPFGDGGLPSYRFDASHEARGPLQDLRHVAGHVAGQVESSGRVDDELDPDVCRVRASVRPRRPRPGVSTNHTRPLPDAVVGWIASANDIRRWKHRNLLTSLGSAIEAVGGSWPGAKRCFPLQDWRPPACRCP